MISSCTAAHECLLRQRSDPRVGRASGRSLGGLNCGLELSGGVSHERHHGAQSMNTNLASGGTIAAARPWSGFPKSVSGNSFLSGTGHWPVPPDDSPVGTGIAPEPDKDGPLGRGRLALPVGGSPTGTGGSPVLPIFRTRSKPVRVILAAILSFAATALLAEPEADYDLVLRGGRIVDGTGN